MRSVMNKTIFRVGAVGLMALAVAACPPDDQRTETLDPTTAGRGLSDEARVQLDSGNAAYRAADYETALIHFDRVVELAPGDATGWFGVYMAFDAMGNKTAADSALAEARSDAPGASLIRDTIGGKP